jgi:hypothetical protein
MKNYVLGALSLVICLAAYAYYQQRSAACEATGGVLVDDAFGWGFECVEPKR